MTRRLGNVKARQVRRLLHETGYQRMPGRGKGSHEAYRHPGTGRWTTLSWKEGEVVPTGTVKRIARDVGLSTARFLEHLQK